MDVFLAAVAYLALRWMLPTIAFRRSETISTHHDVEPNRKAEGFATMPSNQTISEGSRPPDDKRGIEFHSVVAQCISM